MPGPDDNFKLDPATAQEAFGRLNAELFGGQLDRIPIKFSNAVRKGGSYTAKMFYEQPNAFMRRMLRDYRIKDIHNQAITLSRRVILTQEALDRVMAHELIHQWQSEVLGISEDNGGHGETFRSKMDEINAVKGAGFVTVTSDIVAGGTGGKAGQTYYVAIFEKGGRFGGFSRRPFTEDILAILGKTSERRGIPYKTVVTTSHDAQNLTDMSRMRLNSRSRSWHVIPDDIYDAIMAGEVVTAALRRAATRVGDASMAAPLCMAAMEIVASSGTMVVYHATLSGSDILEGGFKKSDEVERVGLGGSSMGGSVSLTTDWAVARGIHKSFVMMHSLVNSTDLLVAMREHFESLGDRLAKSVLSFWESADGRDLLELLDGWKPKPYGSRAQTYDQLAQQGFKPTDAAGDAGGEGDTLYYQWLEPVTDEDAEKMVYTYVKVYFYANDDEYNPVFMGGDASHFKGIPRDDIGVITVEMHIDPSKKHTHHGEIHRSPGYAILPAESEYRVSDMSMIGKILDYDTHPGDEPKVRADEVSFHSDAETEDAVNRLLSLLQRHRGIIERGGEVDVRQAMALLRNANDMWDVTGMATKLLAATKLKHARRAIEQVVDLRQRSQPSDNGSKAIAALPPAIRNEVEGAAHSERFADISERWYDRDEPAYIAWTDRLGDMGMSESVAEVEIDDWISGKQWGYEDRIAEQMKWVKMDVPGFKDEDAAEFLELATGLEEAANVLHVTATLRSAALRVAGQYLYHSTLADSLLAIAEQGLDPAYGGGNFAMEGWSEGKVFFSEDPQKALYYGENAMSKKWDFRKDPPVLLRVPAGSVETERDKYGDLYTEHVVPPNLLEAKTPEGWQPLDEEIAENARDIFGEQYLGRDRPVLFAPDFSVEASAALAATATKQGGDDHRVELTENEHGGVTAFLIYMGEQVEDAYADIHMGTADDFQGEDSQYYDFLGSFRLIEESGIVGVLTGLEIPEDLRGRGLGREMVEAATKWAFSHGAVAVYTHSVGTPGDPDPESFYERLGFEAVDRDSVGNPYMRLGPGRTAAREPAFLKKLRDADALPSPADASAALSSVMGGTLIHNAAGSTGTPGEDLSGKIQSILDNGLDPAYWAKPWEGSPGAGHPQAVYLSLASNPTSTTHSPAYLLVEPKFARPLVMRAGDDDGNYTWGPELNEATGKSGAGLSSFLRAKGYDSVITVNKYGVGEVAYFGKEPLPASLPEPDRTAHALGVAAKIVRRTAAVEDIYRGVKTVVEKYKGKGLFARFSDVPKIGIRPSTEHHDPYGVYFYPVDWLAENAGFGTTYVNLPYITVARIKRSGWLNLATVRPAKARDLAEKGGVLEEYEARTEGKGLNQAKGGRAGKRLWDAVEAKVKPFESNANKMEWNRIFGRMGVKAIYDPGTGSVNTAEPSQIVVLDLSLIEVVDVVENKEDRKSVFHAVLKAVADEVLDDGWRVSGSHAEGGISAAGTVSGQPVAMSVLPAKAGFEMEVTLSYHDPSGRKRRIVSRGRMPNEWEDAPAAYLSEGHAKSISRSLAEADIGSGGDEDAEDMLDAALRALTDLRLPDLTVEEMEGGAKFWKNTGDGKIEGSLKMTPGGGELELYAEDWLLFGGDDSTVIEIGPMRVSWEGDPSSASTDMAAELSRAVRELRVTGDAGEDKDIDRDAAAEIVRMRTLSWMFPDDILDAAGQKYERKTASKCPHGDYRSYSWSPAGVQMPPRVTPDIHDAVSELFGGACACPKCRAKGRVASSVEERCWADASAALAAAGFADMNGMCLEASVVLCERLRDEGVDAGLVRRWSDEYGGHWTVRTPAGEFDPTIAWWGDSVPEGAERGKLYEVGDASPHMGWEEDATVDEAAAYRIATEELGVDDLEDLYDNALEASLARAARRVAPSVEVKAAGSLRAWHGTSSELLAAIREAGGLSDPYLAATPQLAEYYAEGAAEDDDGEAVVLEIDVRDMSRLRHDGAAMDELVTVGVDEDDRDAEWSRAAEEHPEWVHGDVIVIPSDGWEYSWRGSHSVWYDGLLPLADIYGIGGNAGCDNCGNADSMPGSKYCEGCIQEEADDNPDGQRIASDTIAFSGLPDAVRADITGSLHDAFFADTDVSHEILRGVLEDMGTSLPTAHLPVAELAAQSHPTHGASDIAVADLAETLRRVGELDPILMNAGRFYDGGHRLLAYEAEGRDTIPTVDIAPLLTADWEAELNEEIPGLRRAVIGHPREMATTRYWHGTTARAMRSIEGDGYIHAPVYLADSPAAAKEFAEMAADDAHDRPLVLEIVLPQDRIDKLRRDQEFDGAPGNFISDENVPLEWIPWYPDPEDPDPTIASLLSQAASRVAAMDLAAVREFLEAKWAERGRPEPGQNCIATASFLSKLIPGKVVGGQPKGHRDLVPHGMATEEEARSGGGYRDDEGYLLPHLWVEAAGRVYDLTADQFGGEPVTVTELGGRYVPSELSEKNSAALRSVNAETDRWMEEWTAGARSDDRTASAWYYHGSAPDDILDIAQWGLLARDGRDGVSVTSDVGKARAWAGLKSGDRDIEVFRIPASALPDLTPEDAAPAEPDTDFTAGRQIPPEHLEIMRDGKWVSLLGVYGEFLDPVTASVEAWHGTDADFTEFDPAFTRGQLGFHFGTEGQAGDVLGEETAPRRIIRVELDIENPLRMPDLGGWQGHSAKAEFEKALDTRIPGSGSHAEIVRAVTAAGHDSIVYANEFEGDGDSYIVFDASRVRIIDPAAAALSRAARAIGEHLGDTVTAYRALAAEQAEKVMREGFTGPHHTHGVYYTASQYRAMFYARFMSSSSLQGVIFELEADTSRSQADLNDTTEWQSNELMEEVRSAASDMMRALEENANVRLDGDEIERWLGGLTVSEGYYEGPEQHSVWQLVVDETKGTDDEMSISEAREALPPGRYGGATVLDSRGVGGIDIGESEGQAVSHKGIPAERLKAIWIPSDLLWQAEVEPPAGAETMRDFVDVIPAKFDADYDIDFIAEIERQRDEAALKIPTEEWYKVSDAMDSILDRWKSENDSSMPGHIYSKLAGGLEVTPEDIDHESTLVRYPLPEGRLMATKILRKAIARSERGQGRRPEGIAASAIGGAARRAAGKTMIARALRQAAEDIGWSEESDVNPDSFVDEGFVEDESGHAFWGSQGSGCLFVRNHPEDGRQLLLVKRSPSVEEPNTWGTTGGAVPKGESNLFASAVRETREEIGSIPPYEAVRQYVWKAPGGSFTYTTFILECTDMDWLPAAFNWEATDAQWASLEEAASYDLHFGLMSILKDLGESLFPGGAA